MEYMQKQRIAMCSSNELIDKLRKDTFLDKEEYLYLIKNRDCCSDYLFKNAEEVRRIIFAR